MVVLRSGSSFDLVVNSVPELDLSLLSSVFFGVLATDEPVVTPRPSPLNNMSSSLSVVVAPLPNNKLLSLVVGVVEGFNVVVFLFSVVVIVVVVVIVIVVVVVVVVVVVLFVVRLVVVVLLLDD